jgi:hypothetical protein
VVSIDAKTIDRQTLSLLPSRFVFQHHILPIEVKENAVVLATYDLFNSVGRQLATQLLKKPVEWALVPRGQILRAMKTLYGVGAETFDEILKTNRSFEFSKKSNRHRMHAHPGSIRRQFVNQIIREAIIERPRIPCRTAEDDLLFISIDGITRKSRCRRSCGCRAARRTFRDKSPGAIHRRAPFPCRGRPDRPAPVGKTSMCASHHSTVNGDRSGLRLLSRTEQRYLDPIVST